jgi:DNA helicase II / ATP-dependent DNA helicase PcrA
MENRGVTIWAFDQCQHDYEIACRNLMIRQLIENHGALTNDFSIPLHLVFGLRLRGAELDLLAVTPHGIFIGDLKQVYGRLRGGMNGSWFVEKNGRISPVRRNENPWEQLRRYRGQVIRELEKFEKASALIGPNRDDCCRAGLVQVPTLDIKTDVCDRWWYQCGVGEWIPLLLTCQGQTIINVDVVVRWLSSIGCQSQTLREVAQALGVLRTFKGASAESSRNRPKPENLLTPELDDVQIGAAFRKSSEPFVILAGPGAGKTSVVVERSRHLRTGLKKGEWIAIVSYTNSAADEIMSRLGERVTSGEVQDLFVGTFHKFAIEVMSRSSEESSPNSILDERTSVWRYSCCNGISEEQAKAELRAVASNSLNDLTEVVRARWSVFLAHLRRHKVAVFESLLHEMLRVIESEPCVLPNSLVYDEFQDVSPTQGLIVRRMAEAGVEITVVGDPEQSIFGFNGCNPESLISFANNSGRTNVAKLARNYRSMERIVTLSSKLRKTEGVDLQVEASGPSGPGQVELLGFHSDREQVAHVALWVTNLHEKEGIQFNEIAILFRDWNSQTSLCKALDELAVPYQRGGGVSHTPRPLRQLVALSFVGPRIDDPETLFSVLQTLPRISSGLVRKFLESEAGGVPHTLNSVAHATYSMESRYHEEITHIQQMVENVMSLRHHAPSEELRWVWENIVRPGMTREETRRSHEFKAVLDRWCDYLDLCPEASHKELREVVSKLDDGEEIVDSVHLGTIHSAKGRQWAAVAVVDICDDAFVRRGCDMKEEIRLLHVACSRPVSRLLLGFPNRRGTAIDGGVIRALFEKHTGHQILEPTTNRF